MGLAALGGATGRQPRGRLAALASGGAGWGRGDID